MKFLYYKIERVLHAKLSKLVMTDITFFEDSAQFNVLGRSKVAGSSTKQMRHVIPYSFVSKLIEHLIVEPNSPQDAFANLVDILPIFTHTQQGFALTSEDLDSSPFKACSTPIKAAANRAMKGGGSITYLLSPGQAGAIGTPSKQAIASEKFQKENLTYIKAAMSEVYQIISSCDSNTAIIASEILSRFIFTISNQSQHVSFAKEGNTAPYEIRLYESPAEARRGKKDYTIVTARELKEMHIEEITKCIRIVNCEGARVKAAPKALSKLNSLINHYNVHKELNVDLIETYNKNNFELKLANHSNALLSYNKSIPTKGILFQKLETIISKHVAKILYSVFDLTALETYILRPMALT